MQTYDYSEKKRAVCNLTIYLSLGDIICIEQWQCEEAFRSFPFFNFEK